MKATANHLCAISVDWFPALDTLLQWGTLVFKIETSGCIRWRTAEWQRSLCRGHHWSAARVLRSLQPVHASTPRRPQNISYIIRAVLCAGSVGADRISAAESNEDKVVCIHSASLVGCWLVGWLVCCCSSQTRRLISNYDKIVQWSTEIGHYEYETHS